MTDVLIVGDTERCSELRHELPLRIGDPFIYAEIGDRRIAVVWSIEGDRIAVVDPTVEIVPVETISIDDLIAAGVDYYEVTPTQVVRAVQSLGIAKARVPHAFPLRLADELRAAGIELVPDQRFFDLRRRDDFYSLWYARKLWRLLPAIYRAMDGEPPGPLQELVARIGAQAATLRRSIDRLWEDQSIETCDDWAIPYIGDLLGTRLVAVSTPVRSVWTLQKRSISAAATARVGLLEELAADIAGHDARVVEFFRRLGRTRHSSTRRSACRRARSIPRRRQSRRSGRACRRLFAHARRRLRRSAQPLRGRRTRTPRSMNSPISRTCSRRGAIQRLAQHSASRRLPLVAPTAFPSWPPRRSPVALRRPAAPSTRPAATSPCSPHPRAARNPLASIGSAPDEWELPVAIRDTAMGQRCRTTFIRWPSGWGWAVAAPPRAPAARASFALHPQQGRLQLRRHGAGRPRLSPAYHFGLHLRNRLPADTTSGPTARENRNPPRPPYLSPGGTGLDTALSAITADATLVHRGQPHLSGPNGEAFRFPPARPLCCAPANQQRPVMRWPGPDRIGPSTATASPSLTLQNHAAARGRPRTIGRVRYGAPAHAATLDPGHIRPRLHRCSPAAIDGMGSAPRHTRVEGTIHSLVIERSYHRSNTYPQRRLGRNPRCHATALSSPSPRTTLAPRRAGAGPVRPRGAGEGGNGCCLSVQIRGDLSLHRLWRNCEAYVPASPVPPTPASPPSKPVMAGLDRAALEAAYPLALADLALGFASGTVSLSRCTVLGSDRAVHRLNASECILHDIALVEDPQHGCVRFSAYAQGSALHPALRSVAIAAARARSFVTRLFGQPDYARLRRDADAAILAPAARQTPSWAGRRTAAKWAPSAARAQHAQAARPGPEIPGIHAGRPGAGLDRRDFLAGSELSFVGSDPGESKLRPPAAIPLRRRTTGARDAGGRCQRGKPHRRRGPCGGRPSTSSARPPRRMTATRSVINANRRGRRSGIGTPASRRLAPGLGHAGPAETRSRTGATCRPSSWATAPPLVALLATEQKRVRRRGHGTCERWDRAARTPPPAPG